jgi:hypothetical protein
VTQTTQKKQKGKGVKTTENSSNPAIPDKTANRKNFNNKSDRSGSNCSFQNLNLIPCVHFSCAVAGLYLITSNIVTYSIDNSFYKLNVQILCRICGIYLSASFHCT